MATVSPEALNCLKALCAEAAVPGPHTTTAVLTASDALACLARVVAAVGKAEAAGGRRQEHVDVLIDAVAVAVVGRLPAGDVATWLPDLGAVYTHTADIDVVEEVTKVLCGVFEEVEEAPDVSPVLPKLLFVLQSARNVQVLAASCRLLALVLSLGVDPRATPACAQALQAVCGDPAVAPSKACVRAAMQAALCLHAVAPAMSGPLCDTVLCKLLPALTLPVSILCVAKYAAQCPTGAAAPALCTVQAVAALLIGCEPYSMWRHGDNPPIIDGAALASAEPLYHCIEAMLVQCLGADATPASPLFERLDVFLRSARYWRVSQELPLSPVAAVSGRCARLLFAIAKQQPAVAPPGAFARLHLVCT